MLDSAFLTLGKLGSVLPLAQTSATPIVTLVLCVAAGIGTVLLLPGRREPAVRKIGGVIVAAAGLVALAALARQTAATWHDLYFWIFAVIAIAAALRVITHPRPVYSALYFVLTALASAGLFVLLWAEFLAAALVLIYAGAILVTYVFVIMLASTGTDGGDDLADCDTTSREPLAAAAVGFALMGVLLVVIFDRGSGAIRPVGSTGGMPVVQRDMGGAPMPQPVGSAQALGQFLFTNQLLNLELAGVILTVSMVGAIIIAGRKLGRVQPVMPPLPQPEHYGTEISGDPHFLRVDGTTDPKAKEYPEQ